jgi:hypothetical protein
MVTATVMDFEVQERTPGWKKEQVGQSGLHFSPEQRYTICVVWFG